MTKLYSRMFPVILILIFEITIATAALTNVWAAVAFYAQKGGSASQGEMYYVAVNDNSGRNIQYQEYESNAVKNVKAFFDDISSADCRIWVYPMALEVSDGDNVLCRFCSVKLPIISQSLPRKRVFALFRDTDKYYDIRLIVFDTTIAIPCRPRLRNVLGSYRSPKP